ncbi:MAG: prepilin-type N-terminal cleavage/methylation domain-containing protein [Chitinispirillaceae bacterium]|nr:prepilin-type N-terminal cleavage/methylation domain-containing protein [Chitinispirillaceae bacterium]
MKKSEKGTKGFTLVEAIVVAAIMAILAAVAIPMYVGYIHDQRQTTVNNLAETAAAAANAFLRRTGNDPTEGDQTPNTPPLNLYFNAANYQITVTGATNTITVTDLQHSGISASRTY